MSFHPGQHVVCVKADKMDKWRRPLVKGQVYTVRNCAVDDRGEFGIRLQEITNACTERGIEYGYYHWRFRPLNDSRLDVFRQHLVSPPAERIEA